MGTLAILLSVLTVICLIGTHFCVNSVAIDILDIGKADCIIISTGTRNVMIDTGEAENLKDIQSALSEKGIKTIDVLILSHFDKDHIGGAAELIQQYNITTVLESSFSSQRQEYADYHTALAEKECSATVLTEDYTFTSDNCTFYVYVPKETAYSRKEDNNASLIVEMDYQGKRFLFCGDAMEERIQEFLSDSPGVFDFVKLPYHGNYLENYTDFLAEVMPVYGVITCSKKNPASEKTLALLEQYCVSVYETEQGTVSVQINANEITISQ